MQRRKIISILCIGLLSIGVAVVLSSALTIAKARREAMEIPAIPPEIQVDVVAYEFDLVKVTSNWPTSLTVENISDKQISGLEILIVAANDDGGPGEMILWGRDPNNGKQTQLFQPDEVLILPIRQKRSKNFKTTANPFSSFKYSAFGSTMILSFRMSRERSCNRTSKIQGSIM